MRFMHLSYIMIRFSVAHRRLLLVAASVVVVAWAQNPPPRPQRDAVLEAQQPSAVKTDRPEQQKSAHDRSDVFNATKAPPVSPVLKGQPKEGKISGFDFARDPLNADRPMQSP